MHTAKASLSLDYFPNPNMSPLAFSIHLPFSLRPPLTNPAAMLNKSPTSLPSRPLRLIPPPRPFIIVSSSLQPQSAPDNHQQSHPEPPTGLGPISFFSTSYNALVYTCIPLLLCGALPFPSLAADAPPPAAPSVPADDSFISNAAQDNSLLSRILGTTVLVMLIYATLGAILLSINNFWENRNDKRDREMIAEQLRQNPGRKTLTEDAPPVKNDAGKVVPGPPLKGNRESRRLEKKMREKELRDKTKREKREAATKASTKDDNSKS